MWASGTFSDLWHDTVRRHGQSVFLLFRDHKRDGNIEQWTYGEFDSLAGRTATRLRELGVGPGDAVHICLKNSPAFVAVWIAVAKLGAWMIPVDPNSTHKDIRRQIERTQPMVGVYSEERAEAYEAGATNSGMKTIKVSETAVDFLDGSPLLGEELVAPALVKPMDRMAVMFTSGTTSEPKGVVLTQANYSYIGHKMSDIINLGSQDRWYVCLPLFHGNAQYYCFLTAMAVGGSVGLTSKFTASGWPFEAKDLEATHASLFAAPIRMILARQRGDAPTLHLKHVWFAQSLAHNHFEAFTKMCGVVPRQLYGMTETTAVVTVELGANPTNDCIGEVLPGRRMVLTDKNTLEPVPIGESGVITVVGRRGVDLFLEYMDNKDITSKSFLKNEDEESWFITGDLAREGENGKYYFVGRVDDVIKVSGENVSLSEVEAKLAEMPGVLEVAVVTKDDAIRDVVPIAYIVPKEIEAPPPIEVLEQWCEEHLVPQERPQEWIFIDELPRTSVGKIRRFMLKK